MQRQFLSEVSAEGPWRFIATRNVGSVKPFHVACADLDAMLRSVGRPGNDARDVWFTTGCFNIDFTNFTLPSGEVKRKTGRHIEYAVAAKALFLDIDIKQDDKHYHTRHDAMIAFKAFLTASGMPLPTWIVETGGGMHIWWALTDPLPAARWRVLATRLKTALLTHGVLCDAGLTQDIARLMRVPGTNNMKTGTPRPIAAVRLMPPVDPALLEQVLQGYDGTVSNVRRAPDLDAKAAAFAQQLGLGFANTTSAPVDYVPTAELGEGVGTSLKPVEFDKVVQRCPLLAHVVSTGGAGLGEEAWKNTLHCAAWAATNPETWAHSMSQGHADYDAAQTESKLYDRIAAKNAGVGPITCKTWAKSELGSHCASCRYRGMVATPIQFGRDNFHLLQSRPEWDIALDGSTVKGVKDSNGNVTWEPRFIGYKFHEHTLIGTADDELHLSLDVEYRGATNKHRVNVKHLADLRSFKRAVGGFMSGTDGTMTDLLGYSEGWVQELRNSVRHIKDSGQLGWIERGGAHGLHLGDVTVWSDGRVEEMAQLGQMASYGIKGRPDAVTAALKLLAAGPPELLVPVAAAYGAPICALTNQQGAVVSMLGDTGAGKSSSLRTGAAIFGDPKRSLCLMTDTTNAAVKRLELARNLFVGWDEAAVAADAANFVNMIFQIVTGRGKSRLTADAKMMATGDYCTIFVVGTNDYMRERIAAMSQMVDAGLARLVEVYCHKPVRQNGHISAQVFASLDGNYGHYGRAWAVYLARNRAEVTKTFLAVLDLLSKRIPDPNGEHRLQLITVAQLYTGLIYAKKMTLLPFDIAAFGDVLIASVLRSNDVLPGPLRQDGNSVGSAEHLIHAFIAEHREGIVKTPEVRFNQPWNMDELHNIGADQLRGKIVGHQSVADKWIWLSVEDIKVWAERRKISYSGVLGSIRRSPAFVRIETVGLGFNTRNIKLPHVAECIVLDLAALGYE